MAKYEIKNQLDYRPFGETWDGFAQKYMAEMARVFRFLNDLRTHTSNNVENVEPEPYQFKCEDNKLYIRSKENDKWIFLMDIAEYGGFKSGTFGKLQAGTTGNMPTNGNADYDTYWSTDRRVYQWLNGKWNIILSKNIADLVGYEDMREEALNHITDKAVTTEGINDGESLVYDASNKKFIPKRFLAITTGQNNWNGEARKIGNVADPTGANDVVTLTFLSRYIDKIETGNYNNFFDIDVDGSLMPSLNPTYSKDWEIDNNGNIMPK